VTIDEHARAHLSTIEHREAYTSHLGQYAPFLRASSCPWPLNAPGPSGTLLKATAACMRNREGATATASGSADSESEAALVAAMPHIQAERLGRGFPLVGGTDAFVFQ
jgi:hypothetical protein